MLGRADACRFGGEATKRFGDVFTPGFTKHVFVDTDVLATPVTEVRIAFFAHDISPAGQTAVAARFSAFATAVLDRCADARGVSVGWGLEADFPFPGADGEEGGKGRLFVALVGWGSVGECEAFRETEGFGESERVMTEMEGCVGMDRFYLECKVLEKAGRE